VPDVRSAIHAIDYGAFKYLLKPVDEAELASVVDRAVTLNRIARLRRQAADALGQSAMLLGDRAGLEAKFSRAIDSLWIAYQPIVRSNDGHVFGYEGLMRTREPALPHPSAVIEAAERLDRLGELGQSVRHRAAEPLLNGPSTPVLFVNLHPQDLADPSLRSPNALLSQIAHRVVLEVTERTSLDHVVDVRKHVKELRSMGFRIALDDLGSGYAGLASLATLEPEIVKLDMVLIRDVHCSSTKQKLIGSMTALCKDMGMTIVAEGVEKPEERSTLIDLGCDLLQGFLFAEPGPAFPDVLPRH
jgi:EAL domain-containing protein (putative c-di-GMP-specific phosphodiesterase class I)